MSQLRYKARRKSDGLFLGNKKRGQTHSAQGNTYISPARAIAALKASLMCGYNKDAVAIANDHEVVAYETKWINTQHIAPVELE